MIITDLITIGGIFCGGAKSFLISHLTGDMEKYLDSCKSDFWREIFKAELEYILSHLNGAKDVLSVGCGPAV